MTHRGFVISSTHAVRVIPIAGAAFVLQSGDPTGASWPVSFLVLFGMALMLAESGALFQEK